MPQPILHTARLRLEPLSDRHLEFEVELDSDIQVMTYITGRAASRAEVERAHRRRLRAAQAVPGRGFWAGFADDTFVGWWILQPPNGPDQPRFVLEAELGYRVVRQYWRRGYASEGSRELIRYGFTTLGLKRIFAQARAENAPSRATMSAVGLNLVREFVPGAPRGHSPLESEPREVEYDIRRKQWRRRPAS